MTTSKRWSSWTARNQMCQMIGISIVRSSSSNYNNRNKSSMKCNWSSSGSLNRACSKAAPPQQLKNIVRMHLSFALPPHPRRSIKQLPQP